MWCLVNDEEIVSRIGGQCWRCGRFWCSSRGRSLDSRHRTTKPPTRHFASTAQCTASTSALLLTYTAYNTLIAGSKPVFFNFKNCLDHLYTRLRFSICSIDRLLAHRIRKLYVVSVRLHLLILAKPKYNCCTPSGNVKTSTRKKKNERRNMPVS